MACIVLVGGIPGSGKSMVVDCLVKHKSDFFVSSGLCSSDVYCNSQIQTHSVNRILVASNNVPEIVSISYDELSTAAEQQKLVDIPNGWKDFRKDFLDAVECYVCFLHHVKCELVDISSRAQAIFDYMRNKYSGSGSRVILLVEDNFYYSSMRYKWFQVCRKYELGFCQIFLNCAVDVALRRNNTRVIKVPETVIRIMSEKLELPDLQKNPWEKFSFVLNTTKDYETVPIGDIAQLIGAAVANPPEPIIDVSEQKKEAQMKCSQNVVHQIDKILRRLTGQVVMRLLTEDRSKEDLKILTSKISQTRQKLLRDLSDGTLRLPLSVTEAIRNHEVEGKDTEVEKCLCVLLENKIVEILRI